MHLRSKFVLICKHTLYTTLFTFVVGVSVASAQNSSTSLPQELLNLPPVDCIVSPHKIVDLSSAVPGVISHVHKTRSEYVEQGEVVAQLASDVEQAAVALAQARTVIRSELGAGKANLAFAQRQQARFSSLHGQDAISVQRKEEAERELQLSEWELLRAKDLMKIRQLELVRAEAELKQKEVVAPLTGFVVNTFKSPGEFVENKPIMRIVQLDPLNVEAILPMALFGKVQPGMTAEIKLDAMRFGTHEASVTLVDKTGDAGSGTFGIRLSLPNPEHKIPSGLKCDLSFASQKTNLALQPHSAELIAGNSR